MTSTGKAPERGQRHESCRKIRRGRREVYSGVDLTSMLVSERCGFLRGRGRPACPRQLQHGRRFSARALYCNPPLHSRPRSKGLRCTRYLGGAPNERDPAESPGPVITASYIATNAEARPSLIEIWRLARRNRYGTADEPEHSSDHERSISIFASRRFSSASDNDTGERRCVNVLNRSDVLQHDITT